MTTSPITPTSTTQDRTRQRGVSDSGEFAGLLAQQAAPVQPTEGDAQHTGEAPRNADAERADSAEGQTRRAGSVPVQAAPETIHSVNQKLLLEGSGAGRTPETGPPTQGADVQRGEGGAEAPVRTRAEQPPPKPTGNTPDARNEASTNSRASDPNPDRAASDQDGRTPRDRGPSNGSQGVPAQPQGAAAEGSKLQDATAAAWQNAMARIMGPVARDVSSIRTVSGGPQAIMGVQGAQGRSPVGTNARAGNAPPTTLRMVRAGAEAFETQIAKGVAAAMGRGTGTLTLRLKPEALGQVNIRVQMKEGTLTARFEARTAEARELLMQHTPDLERSLEAAGVKVARIATVLSPEAQTDGSGIGANQDGAGPGSHAPPDGDTADRREPERRMLTGDSYAPDREGADGGGGTTHWITLGLDTIA